jgi:hypothetical protein
MDARKILRYYGLRFQIEFLIRDGKQYTGLEDCQARSKDKLNTHFNLVLTNVNWAKVEHYLSIPKDERQSFSLQDSKRKAYNRAIVNFIFSNLAIDLNGKKIKQLHNECINLDD